MDMFANVSALSAFANGMQVTAHNIANISTNNFRSQSYSYQSGPGDRGVDFVTPYGAHNRDVPPPPEMPQAQENSVNWEYMNNDVDLPREITHMIQDQRSYQANGAAIRAFEDTSGVLIDMVV